MPCCLCAGAEPSPHTHTHTHTHTPATAATAATDAFAFSRKGQRDGHAKSVPRKGQRDGHAKSEARLQLQRACDHATLTAQHSQICSISTASAQHACHLPEKNDAPTRVQHATYRTQIGSRCCHLQDTSGVSRSFAGVASELIALHAAMRKRNKLRGVKFREGAHACNHG